jgi:hypothetical protein
MLFILYLVAYVGCFLEVVLVTEVVKIPDFPLQTFVSPNKPPLKETLQDQKNYCLHLKGRRINFVLYTETLHLPKTFAIRFTNQKAVTFVRGSYVETDNIFCYLN